MQDLYSTDPTQESGPRSFRLYGSHPEACASWVIHTRNRSALPGRLDDELNCSSAQVGIDRTYHLPGYVCVDATAVFHTMVEVEGNKRFDGSE